MNSKALVAAAALVLLALASSADSGTAVAGGFAFELSPNSGELGTTVQLRTSTWTPGDFLEVYAAFSASLTEHPSDDAFMGPLASTTSDSGGAWSVPVQIADTSPLRIPDEPGFLFFRVRSPIPSSQVRRSPVPFALISEGRRPAGAGEIRLSISLAPGVTQDSRLITWSYGGLGGTSPFRVISAPGWPTGTSLPFVTTISFLQDGDWAVTALATGGLVPVGEGPVQTVEAPVCSTYPCPDGPQPSYVVRTVTIRDANVVDLSLVLGPKDTANTLAAAGQGEPGQPSSTLTFALVALSLGGAALLVVGLLARRIRFS
ncbi:MAG: hypothetical protein J4N95_03930 [Chloroflexi bacterium]|nr:hypothetical protein [Chloroflexota bacterium]